MSAGIANRAPAACSTFARTLLRAAALLVPLACSGGGGSTDADISGDASDEASALHEFGEPCAGDGECRSGVCFESACTRTCRYRTDGPADGWTCGSGGAGRVLCVTSRYVDGTGRAGSSCAVDSCDEAAGYRCIRQSASDPYAYCSHDCTDDRDCPYDMDCRAGDDGRYCRPRSYCEPCVADDQCGYANDDCIADDEGDKFCSQTCDPAEPSTCPTDSLCVEVPATGSGHWQCKPSFGRCVGDGNICEPCRATADCHAGSDCITDYYTKLSFCGSPCDSSTDCPTPEYYCTTDTSQCRPKKGSCLHPSGGGHTCDSCADFTDCYDGYCLDNNGDGVGDSCGDLCSTGDAGACAPWGTCTSFSTSTGGFVYACVPHTGMQCWQYASCVTDCPDGPPCSHSYCR